MVAGSQMHPLAPNAVEVNTCTDFDTKTESSDCQIKSDRTKISDIAAICTSHDHTPKMP